MYLLSITTATATVSAMSKHPATVALEGFDIAIDRDAEVPIGVQLAWALRTRIRDGRFQPSQRLPGLRELAEGIGVNVNTVRAVYQRLEHEGLIDSQQGSGTFVAAVQREPSAVGTIAADAAREAQATGVDPREVAAALYVAAETPDPPLDDAAEHRRLLRTQIGGLERTLGELEAAHPGLITAPAKAHRGAGPTLPNVSELEEVRTQLVRRLVTLQAAIDAQASAPGFAGMDQRASARERKRVEVAKRAAAGKRAAVDKRAGGGAGAMGEQRTNRKDRVAASAKASPRTATDEAPSAAATKPKRASRPRRAGTRPAPAGT
jgi:DNA-binding transcriptional regulator YhcF (GntR family)